MVISRRYKMSGFIEFDLNRDLFRTLSSKCPFIVASEGVDLALRGEDNGVQSSAGNFVDFGLVERIRDDLVSSFVLIIIFQVEVLDVGQTNWPF
jgi:hypothetical protein